MATPPTYVSEGGDVWNSDTTPKTHSQTLAANDVLVIGGITEDSGRTLNTPTGGTPTYSLAQSHTLSSNCGQWVWTAIGTTTETYTLSVTAGAANPTYWWGYSALRWSGSDGVGASAKNNASSGAPTVTLTTTQDNSGIVCYIADWSAADWATRTWTTINGSTPTAGNGQETTYFRDSSHMTLGAAYWPDAGAAGAKTVGLTAPTSGMTWVIIAVEVKGATATSIPWTPPRTAPIRDYGKAQWTQRDRRDANRVGTAADPLPSPLDSAWQADGRYWHLYTDTVLRDRRNYPTQRPYGYDPNLLSPVLTDPLTLAAGVGGDMWRRYHTSAYADRRGLPQQKTLTSDPQLLTTALLEHELLGAAQTGAHYAVASTHADRRQATQQRRYASPPDLLGTALLENELLGGIDDRCRRYGSAAFYDRREVPAQRLYVSAPGLLDTAQLENELLGGAGTAGRHGLAATHVDRRKVPPQRPYVSDPNLLTSALLELELLGGATTPSRYNSPATHTPRWWMLHQSDRSASTPGLLDTALLDSPLLGSGDEQRHRQATAHYDRRETPGQRPYVSDPSWYPAVEPADPLTVAFGVGGTYWLIYNTAALTVDRREVPHQRCRISDPGLLSTALLEEVLLGGADMWRRYHAPVTHVSRRPGLWQTGFLVAVPGTTTTTNATWHVWPPQSKWELEPPESKWRVWPPQSKWDVAEPGG